MLAPWEEEAYYEWQLREDALDWQSLQQSYKDVLQKIPKAEGLDEFHRHEHSNSSWGKPAATGSTSS